MDNNNTASPSPIPTTTTRRKSAKSKRRPPPEEDEDAMMTDEDVCNSIATTMGVRADTQGLLVMRPPQELDNASVAGNSLILPWPLLRPEDKEAEACNDMEDDDISTLTEYSMAEEADNGSQMTQNTAWTVVTTGTGSTTVPTKNVGSSGTKNMHDRKPRVKGKHNLMKDGDLLSNSQYKRRRMA